MKAKWLKSLKRTGKRITSNVGLADKEKLALQRNRLIAALFITSVVLVVFGLFVVYSAISYDSNYSFAKQIGGVIFGLVLMLVI